MVELVEQFKQYRMRADLTRIRMSSVPEDMKPLVKAYRQALSDQLNDPENESWASLGPNEHLNAMEAVVRQFGPQPMRRRIKGNCPRCSGEGFILAFSHVRGGRCIKCEGTGSV